MSQDYASDIVNKLSKTNLVDGQVFDDKTLDNTVNAAKYGRYKFARCTVGTATAQPVNGGEQNQITIQPGWWNPAHSYAEFQISITPGTTTTNFYWMHQFYAFIRQIIVDTGSSQPMNLNNVHHYFKMVAPRLTRYEDFKRNDIVSQLAPCRSLPSSNKLPASGNDCAIPYEDFKYCTYVAQGNAGATTMCIRMYGKDMPGTFLADDRSHKLGPNQPSIQITYENLNKWLWMGTSATNPNTGGTAVEAGTAATITLSYYQAIEQDPNIIRELDAEYTSGRKMLIQYAENTMAAQPFNATPAPTSQNYGFNVNAGRFATVCDIFYSVFGGTETNQNALDNDTFAQSKVQQYYTQLNGVQEQPGTLNVGYVTSADAYVGFDDYSFLLNRNKHSSIQSIQQHYNNWTHWSSYRQPSKMEQLPNYNILQGLSAVEKALRFDFVSTTAAVNTNHWGYTVGQVFLIYGPNGCYLDNGSKAQIKAEIA